MYIISVDVAEAYWCAKSGDPSPPGTGSLSLNPESVSLNALVFAVNL